MRKPKISTKRVLGLVMATALAVSGIVAVAGSSEAAAITVTLNPKTGPAANTTQVITVTGKGFKSGATVKVSAVEFATTCNATSGSGTAATSFSAVSATKLVVTTPSLTLAGTSTNFLMCIYDTAGTPALLGSGKYTIYAAPAITSYTPVTGSSQGGGTISLVGTDFTKASVVYVDGVAAKTTFVDDTGLTAVTPAHVAGTGYKVKVTTEGGSVTSATTFDYINGITVSPSFGDGTAGNVVSVKGTGFSKLNIQQAATTVVSTATVTNANLYLVRSGTTLTAGTASTTTPTNGFPCLTVQVQSDTELNCKLPVISAANAGAYNLVLLTTGATQIIGAGSSGYSSTSVYTVSAF